MRIFIIMMALLLTTASGFAADQDTSKVSGKSPKTADVKKNTNQKSTEGKKTLTWPRPYKSSEEISVDSIVPFPTDI